MALTLDSSGNLYGTTEYGGNTALNGGSGDGTAFKISAGTNTLTTLATFNNTNGALPLGSLTLDGSGNLYGTTEGGGAGYGTVFEIAAGTNTLTTLASFNNTNGSAPEASLTLDSSGNLYGTTFAGGASGDGTVFKLAAGTNTLTTLATFTGTANGANPHAGVTLDSSGNLYGTTEYRLGGAAGNDGTVFKIAAGNSTITTLASFTGTNGAYPYAGVTLDSSGNLYGTTSGGGANGDGTVFELSLGGTAAPEPNALAILLSGLPSLGGVVAYRRRHSRLCASRSLDNAPHRKNAL